jgi:hypothetical protein
MYVFRLQKAQNVQNNGRFVFAFGAFGFVIKSGLVEL